MSNAEEVVRQFCAVAGSHDPDALRTYLAEDVVYHNIPLEPAVGLDAAMAVFDMMTSLCEGITFEVHHLVSTGDVVLTERTDYFTINGTQHPLPVMGTFEVRDGKITAWRDYFDMAQVTAIFGAA